LALFNGIRTTVVSLETPTICEGCEAGADLVGSL
jgi:hypothetical protein